jgi:alkylhydroperoxidase/carboxymuconolactone decarboxylase family protein YurZ
MDERTKLLVSLAAATAANCIPCFEYLFCEAEAAKLTREEIQTAVDLASKVKNGAHIALKNSMNDIMGLEEQHNMDCSEQSKSSLCG